MLKPNLVDDAGPVAPPHLKWDQDGAVLDVPAVCVPQCSVHQFARVIVSPDSLLGRITEFMQVQIINNPDSGLTCKKARRKR